MKHSFIFLVALLFSNCGFGLDICLLAAHQEGKVVNFKLKGGLMLIKGSVEGVEGYFIFDSGAPDLILNVFHFKKIAKPINEQGSGIIESLGQIFLVKSNGLQLDSTLLISTKDVKAADLSNVESAKGIKIMGLIGVRIFQKFHISIDYANLRLFFYQNIRQDFIPHKLDSLLPSDTVSIKMHDKLIYTEIKVGNKKLTMGIDTGAELNLLSIKNQKKVLDNFIIQNRVVLSGAGKEKTEVLAGIVNFEISGIKFLHQQTLLTDLSNISQSYGLSLDGILGFPFLSYYRSGFNIEKGEFYVEKK